MVDHVFRVFRRRLHCRHARPLLGGGGFEQDAVELKLDVLRQQVAQDLLGGGLVEILDGVGDFVPGAVDREQPLHAHGLGNDRLELVVRDVHGVDAPADEIVGDGLRDLLRGFE